MSNSKTDSKSKSEEDSEDEQKKKHHKNKSRSNSKSSENSVSKQKKKNRGSASKSSDKSKSKSKSESKSKSKSKDSDTKKDKDKKHKHHSHHHKHHKEDKKDKEKSREKSKSKEKKKHKKHKKQPKKYGYYGIIGKEHFHDKRDEFIMWMQEVKNVNYENLKQLDEKKYFDEFCEDYNTVTFPHKKYYNLKVWEKYQQKKNQSAQNPQQLQIQQDSQENFNIIADDEHTLQKQRVQRMEDFEQGLVAAAYKQLYNDEDMANKMDMQISMRQQINHLYKTGNVDEARELQKIHNPDKKKNLQNKNG